MKELLRTLKGSRVYGTDIEGSDYDYFSLFQYPIDSYLGLNYKNQIDNSDDDVSMEIGRYLQLLIKGSPVQVETLFTDPKFFTHYDNKLDILLDQKKQFLTKKLKASYTGFIHSQLSKAKSITHRLDWEQNEVPRKDIIDFCYILLGGEKSVKLRDHFGMKSDDFKHFSSWGLAKVNNMEGLYSMYFLGKGKGGIFSENSNEVQLRSIPKNGDFRWHFRFDSNGYSSHCKQYKEYKHWLDKRNPERYKAIIETGSIVDLKFFYHTIRLLNTAIEIFRDNELIVDRRGIDAEYLKSIRAGKVSLEELNEKAEKGLAEIEILYNKSNLPEEVNYDFVNDLCIKLRKQ